MHMACCRPPLKVVFGVKHISIAVRSDKRAATSAAPPLSAPAVAAAFSKTGFIGPAVLLHLLRPKLAACGTAVLLTASPSHRLAALTDIHSNLTSWGQSTAATTQVVLCSVSQTHSALTRVS